MRILLLLALPVLSSCVAPSLTIYGIGPDGKPTKEVQLYGDAVGKFAVTGSIASVTAEGGYYNSTVVRETYLGAAEIGRSTIQPIVWSIVTGGTLGAAVGAAKVAAP